MTGPEADAAFAAAVGDAGRSAISATRERLHVMTAAPHRSIMSAVKLFTAAYASPLSGVAGDERLIEDALTLARALEARQGTSGLFRGGDNVESPPDSAFTINDVCDTLEVVHRVGAGGALVAELSALLEGIADAAEPALLAGGVHTPNHRWELSAALARLNRWRPSERLRSRVETWLDEGVDIDADGMYSERSANYAAHVSNPSLTAIADIMGRADLLEVVESNLESTLGLILPDGSVETVHSRRQDQNDTFSLAPYLTMYRRFAVDSERPEFAWAADRALTQGVPDPATAVAETILVPQITRTMPAPSPVAAVGTSRWPTCSLAVDAREERTLVVYGGSDYPKFGRIRSGLANNPTFLRVFAGEVVIDAVRLSRNFFGLGPFRAEKLRAENDGSSYRLEETVSANYYQPFEARDRSESGSYALGDEGRFSAAMSFERRQRDTVSMDTAVVVAPTPTGAAVDIDIAGPDVPWSLEITFRDGGDFVGGVDLGNGDVHLTGGEVRYRRGTSEVVLRTSDAGSDNESPGYLPGEDYAYVNGTDATAGRHVYLTGRAPGRFTLLISCG